MPCPLTAVKFTTDVGEWTAGVKIRQIAPNEISGSYTFDMHPSSCRTSPPPNPRPKNAAEEAGRPRPVSDPNNSTTASTGTTSRTTKKLHRRSQSAAPSQAPAGARAISNPFNFGILLKRTPPHATTPSKAEDEPATVDAPEPEPKLERRRSLGATFSFLQPRHRRDRLESTSSTPSTKSRVSMGGSEDGELAEPVLGSAFGSKVTPAAEKQAQPQTTRYSPGLYLPLILSRPTSSSHGPTTPVGPPSLPALRLAQVIYNNAQTKKVLKHARAELMREVSKVGYNVLIVEGQVFSFSLFRGEGTDSLCFGTDGNSPSSAKASDIALKSSTTLVLPSPSPIRWCHGTRRT